MQAFINIIRAIAIAGMVLFHLNSFAQDNKNEKDSTQKENRNIFQYAIKAISHNPGDSAEATGVLNTQSEIPFLPYEGKGIRYIIITEYGFEKTFSDTSQRIQYFGTKILNYLHRDTREWVIHDNLFIKEKTALNPFLVADNERYLRSIPFIQDARILVKNIPGMPDSVDMFVITKDLFSLTAEVNDVSPPQKFKAKIGDANVLGMGQSIFVTSLIEKSRKPGFGYEFIYTKNNIKNTFLNISAGYSNIKPDLRDGTSDEHAWHLQFERPLVSQYLHLAGNILFEHHESYNNYARPDSIFYYYHYNTFDAWVGYNLGVKKFLTKTSIKDRQFVSIRYFNNKFSAAPQQLTEKYNFRFDNRAALLGGITFFRQYFYKTNYIYGFGTTEDMPYGYNVAFTAGWYKQQELKRPYAGIDANRYVYTQKGDFIQYYLRTGTFFNAGQFQDASLLIGTGIYSRLFIKNRLKFRQYFNLSFTKQFNRLALDPLSINNNFGVRYFRSDSALGDVRISLYSETFLFLKYKVFGFKFAPFTFGSLTLLKPEEQSFSKSGMYYGLGAGLRTRNENLIFNTVELRVVYFPRKIDQNSFKIYLTTNIRFRLSNGYVHAPDIVQVNSDNQNAVY